MPKLVAVAALLLVAAPVRAQDLTARARRLHESTIVVDTHEDVPDALSSRWADVAVRGATDHFDIPRARAGGLTAPFFSIYVSAAHAETGTAAARALEPMRFTLRACFPGEMKRQGATDAKEPRGPEPNNWSLACLASSTPAIRRGSRRPAMSS